MPMVLFGVVLFVVAEFYLIGQAMDVIGVWTTLLTLLLTAIIGSKVAKREGFATLGNLAVNLQRGDGIGLVIMEAALLLVAGFLFIFPGFISDALALLLLLPPGRRLVARLIFHRVGKGFHQTGYTPGGDVILEGEVCREPEAAPDIYLPLPSAKQPPKPRR